MIREGQKVSYAGDSTPFIDVGTEGKVVALSGTAAHVQWSTGARSGEFDLIEQHELVPAQQQPMRATSMADAFDNSLDMPASMTLQVRATYDESGEDGLLNALSESGHLAVLTEYADSAVEHLATSIRSDPSFSDVLASLEADEAASLVARVASVILTSQVADEET